MKTPKIVITNNRLEYYIKRSKNEQREYFERYLVYCDAPVMRHGLFQTVGILDRITNKII